jgi:prepilin-type N-terminal cleavage/methylation domain-containing protein
VKDKKRGFTIVELLTAVSIIAILIAVLMPSLAMIRKMAKETKQKAQITTIGMALTAFKNDQGDYPPSDRNILPAPVPVYGGAQKLAEALLGRDLLGFHPESDWDVTNDKFYPNPTDQTALKASLEKRRGLYLELGTAGAFKMKQLFEGKYGQFDPDSFVLCDTYGVRQLKLANGTSFKAGTPILYYKANTSSKNMDDMDLRKRIYNANDNQQLMELGILTKSGVDDSGTIKHPLGENGTDNFYKRQYPYDTGKMGYGIIDPKIEDATGLQWPYRPDSYILISAGADGLYGTKDDITNY